MSWGAGGREGCVRTEGGTMDREEKDWEKGMEMGKGENKNLDRRRHRHGACFILWNFKKGDKKWRKYCRLMARV